MNRITSERARWLSGQRETRSGGKLPSCDCGECKRCKKRAEIRKYRKGVKERIAELTA